MVHDVATGAFIDMTASARCDSAPIASRIDMGPTIQLRLRIDESLFLALWIVGHL